MKGMTSSLLILEYKMKRKEEQLDFLIIFYFMLINTVLHKINSTAQTILVSFLLKTAKTFSYLTVAKRATEILIPFYLTYNKKNQ